MDEPRGRSALRLHFRAWAWWLCVDNATLLNYLARFALPSEVDTQEQQFDAVYGPWLLDQWADV